MDNDAIKRLKNDNDFQQFVKYAMRRVKTLNNLKGLDELSNERAGEEAKIRRQCIDTMTVMMEPFLQETQKKEQSVEDVKRAKKRAGI